MDIIGKSRTPSDSPLKGGENGAAGNNRFGLVLFGTISMLFLVYVLVFAFYQSYREREYKKELAGVRVTIINTDGTVLMDTEKDPATMPNHLQRAEVQQALQDGYGFDISRTSETDGERYFYSATYSEETGKIIRSAVPYPGEGTGAPITNRGYIGLSVLIFLLLSLVLYLYTRRVGRHVETTIDDYREQVRKAEEEKVRIKHQLTQNTAHELKTPAASIQGYLETILNTPNLPEDKRQYFLERCYSQSERMNALLKDMATLTKLSPFPAGEAGTLSPIEGQGDYAGAWKFEEVDLSEIIRSVAEDVQLAAQKKGILLEVDIPSKMPMQGDTSLLYSAFRNVLDNAITYSGGTTVKIEANENDPSTGSGANENGNRGYCVSIADDGVGVAEEHLPHLFERFYRVDKGRSRELGGTGLGLAIVKNAIALHGGTCYAESNAPHGLKITMVV